MENRRSIEEKKFIPPHTTFTSYFTRYEEGVMSLTYHYPKKMENAVYVIGAASAALILSSLLPSKIPRPIRAMTSFVGMTGGLLSLTTGILQHKIFGFPIDNEPVYKNTSFTFKGATATMVVNDGHIPKLRITASNYFDAGYAEGFSLCEPMKINLDQVGNALKLIDALSGFPNEQEFKAHFADILKVIPEEYIQEMRGKVTGYNVKLNTLDPYARQLTFEHYLLLQILPDYRNYIPFENCNFKDFFHNIGCTTFAMRVGNYTFFSRTLDWPAYNLAGKYFIEIERAIGNTTITTDIGHPLLSGALTILNQHGVLFQMNVANGKKIKKPEGMPAIFFNRYCAENVKIMSDFNPLLQNKKPLGAYHLIVSDGDETQSLHFFQNLNNPNNHVIEKLNSNRNSPQLLVTANMGIECKDNKIQPLNFRDSLERKENLHAFFKQESIQKKLKSYISKQKEGDSLSSNDINELKQIVLNMARLKLVNNVASVLLAIYVFEYQKIIDASVSLDNLYAPEKELKEFKRLSM